VKHVTWLVLAALAIGACGGSHGKSAAAPTTITAATSTTAPHARVHVSRAKRRHRARVRARTAASIADSTSTTRVLTPTTPATTPPTPPTTPPTVAAVNHVADAVAFVHSHAYVPLGTADFSSPPTGGLHVIVASPTGSADDHTQRAFFFVDGRFIRNDLGDPSGSIQIAWRNNDTIALAYPIYKAADPVCCPSGGSMIVRFEWTGSRIDALDPIPSRTLRR
jgi:LppP/LprE lipoprotein